MLSHPKNITTILQFRSPCRKEALNGVMDQSRSHDFFRAAATLGYVSLDKPCIAYASKEVPQKMSDPQRLMKTL